MMKKRVLFISSRPLFPIVGGDQIRTVQNLELLKKYFDIHTIVIMHDKETEEIASQYSTYGDYTPFLVSKIRFYFQALFFLVNKLPIQVNYYTIPRIKKYIEKRISEYDLVFCNNIRTAEYVRGVGNIPKIIDFVDAISMNYEKARHRAGFIKRMIYSIDYRRCLRYEIQILNDFQASSIISSVDRDYMLNNALSSKKIHVIGNMASYAGEMLNNDNEDNKLIFVGKMSYEPNILAVTNFVNNIFPLIKMRIPNTSFHIVGASPVSSVLKLARVNDVFVTGFVSDVRLYMKSASIVIAPMLSGAGIQNKIIQAMGLGCCVITTSIGAEGLNIDDEIAIMDDNVLFADRIVELLSQPKLRCEMGIKAREYVKANLSSVVIEEQFYDFISSFV